MDDLRLLQEASSNERLELEYLRHELAAERSRREALAARLLAAQKEARRSLEVINQFNADVRDEVRLLHVHTSCAPRPQVKRSTLCRGHTCHAVRRLLWPSCCLICSVSR